MSDPEIVVVGAGPNGLFAACRLARAGASVLVVDRNDRPGGALWSVESTGAGALHDVGAAFVAFHDSAAFRGLDLARHGLSFAFAPIQSAHPAPDGSCAAIAREGVEAPFGSPEDRDTFRAMARWHAGLDAHLVDAFLGTFPTIGPALRIGPTDAARLLRILTSSAAGFARRTFRSEAARRVMPGMGMHVDLGPEDRMGAGIGYILSLRAATVGFGIPVGGARAVTEALTAELRAHGGQLRLGATVDRVAVRRGRAQAVVLRGGEEIRARRAIVADTSAPALYLGLLEGAHVPAWLTQRMRVFPLGWGAFKVDFALDRPAPWTAESARRSGVVHAGDDLADLNRNAAQVRAGEVPDHPYLVIGQQSLVDPLRVPGGGHTLYVYGRVPRRVEGGWEAWRERFADRIVARIEALAPGFSATVRARAVQTPDDLERMSPNLIGGDLGGGSNQWYRQLIFRPVFPWFRYRTPVRGLYLCSSFTHPGTGIHGMCGWNAAEMVLRDLG